MHQSQKNSDLELYIGKISNNSLTQNKYLAISTISLLCRIALFAGIDEEVIYSLSDQEIRKIDHLETINMTLDDYIIALIYKFTVLIQNHVYKVSSLPEAVHQSMIYIKNHHHEKIILDDIADYCRISKHHLCHLFKNHMKMSIGQFINQEKIKLV